MALVVKDRVQETTTTTGTGTVTLAGAVNGFQSFSVIGDGNTTFYTITSGTEFEVGVGTYTASGTTLSRDTVLESSNSGSKITLAGTSNVFVTYPAERSVSEDSDGNVTAKHFQASEGILLNFNSISEDFSLPTDYNGVSSGPVTVETGVTVTVPDGQSWVIL